MYSLISDRKKFSALKAANIEHLVSAIFPHSEIGELRVMILFLLWMHAWDDEMDHCEGEYTNDLAAAQVFCEDTLHSAKFHFGLLEYMEKPTSPNKIIDALEEIGCHFREACSRGRYWHHRNQSWLLTLASRTVSATI